jgi:hypothetical protein
MPTLAELQSRFGNENDSQSILPGSDEVLVADVRGRLTPAQIVEQKLRSLLRPHTAPGTPRPQRAWRRKAK